MIIRKIAIKFAVQVVLTGKIDYAYKILVIRPL